MIEYSIALIWFVASNGTKLVRENDSTKIYVLIGTWECCFLSLSCIILKNIHPAHLYGLKLYFCVSGFPVLGFPLIVGICVIWIDVWKRLPYLSIILDGGSTDVSNGRRLVLHDFSVVTYLPS